MVIVRPAMVSEVHSAVDIWRAAHGAGGLPSHPQRLTQWAHEPGAVMFVADDGNTLVGMALSLPGRADDGAGAQIQGLRHLTGLSVLPDRWGRGIGGQLLDTVLTEASQQGSVRVTLWTHATNLMAHRLFEARGFRRTGRVRSDELGAILVHCQLTLSGNP